MRSAPIYYMLFARILRVYDVVTCKQQIVGLNAIDVVIAMIDRTIIPVSAFTVLLLSS